LSGGWETTLHTCRQAGPGVGELLEGLRWGFCGEERIASASHVLTCHVVSYEHITARRHASHHATHSGPAHMSMTRSTSCSYYDVRMRAAAAGVHGV
jgi:hypothetical protein